MNKIVRHLKYVNILRYFLFHSIYCLKFGYICVYANAYAYMCIHIYLLEMIHLFINIFIFLSFSVLKVKSKKASWPIQRDSVTNIQGKKKTYSAQLITRNSCNPDTENLERHRGDTWEYLKTL